MLEKMARAIVSAIEASKLDNVYTVRVSEDGVSRVLVDGEADYNDVARAALLALREPDQALIDEHLYDGEYGYDAYWFGWQPMIDAILNEKPEGGA